MKLASLIIPFTLVFSLLIGSTLSCSCAAVFESPLDALRGADAVFAGRVTSIRSMRDYNIVRFCARDIWKGKSARIYQVRTYKDSAMCGFNFQINEMYIVYAHRQEGRLWVNLCSRTSLIDNADEDLDQLPIPGIQFDDCPRI